MQHILQAIAARMKKCAHLGRQCTLSSDEAAMLFNNVAGLQQLAFAHEYNQAHGGTPELPRNEIEPEKPACPRCRCEIVWSQGGPVGQCGCEGAIWERTAPDRMRRTIGERQAFFMIQGAPTPSGDWPDSMLVVPPAQVTFTECGQDLGKRADGSRIICNLARNHRGNCLCVS